MQGGIIVAAHFGGHDQWDNVEKYLVGTDIYLDTSMGFDFFPHEQFLRIVKNHGADKILFASDYPWSNAKSEIDQLKSLPLSDNEINAILGENAKRILGINT
jgi:predicted TIM-barrel fold metal-dependent hydrolase